MTESVFGKMFKRPLCYECGDIEGLEAPDVALLALVWAPISFAYHISRCIQGIEKAGMSYSDFELQAVEMLEKFREVTTKKALAHDILVPTPVLEWLKKNKDAA
jgi:hypothetical protein